jgi:hypothetical protein
LLLVSCLAGIIAPAEAADVSTLGCIEAKLGPAAMQRIGDGVVAAADRGTDPSRSLDADRDALLAARQACRVAGNWSADAVQVVISYTQGRATKLGAESALRRDGLDPVKLATVYAALPVQDRSSLIAKASPGAIRAIAAAAPQIAARRHVLLYFAALAAIEFYPPQFATA